MMQLVPLKLLKRVTTGKDSLQQPVYGIPDTLNIMAWLVPISRAEFYNAGQIGILPDYEFIVSAIDYHGQTMVEFNGQRLKVYRTYQKNANEIELYCQYAGGLNGGGLT